MDNPHFSTDGVMRDVIDGEFYNNHPVFRRRNQALLLLGYYDDLEVANPLGSKSKIHKIGKLLPLQYSGNIMVQPNRVV